MEIFGIFGITVNQYCAVISMFIIIHVWVFIEFDRAEHG